MAKKFYHEFKTLEKLDVDVSILLLYSVFLSNENNIISVRKKIRDTINDVTYAYEKNLESLADRVCLKKRKDKLDFLKYLQKQRGRFNLKSSFLLAMPSCFSDLEDMDKGLLNYVDPSFFIKDSNKSRCLLRNIITYSKKYGNDLEYDPFYWKKEKVFFKNGEIGMNNDLCKYLNQELVVISPSLKLEQFELSGNYWYLQKEKEPIFCNIEIKDVNNVLNILYKKLELFKKNDNRKKHLFQYFNNDMKDNNLYMDMIHKNYKYFIHLRVNSNFLLSDLDFVHSLHPSLRKYFAEIDSFIIENYKDPSPMIKSFEDPRILGAFLQEEINSYMYQTLLNVRAVYINKEIIFFNNNYDNLIFDFNLFKAFIREPSMIKMRFPINNKIFFNTRFIKSPYQIFKKKRMDLQHKEEFICFNCHKYLSSFYMKCFHSLCDSCYINKNHDLKKHLNLECLKK